MKKLLLSLSLMASTMSMAYATSNDDTKCLLSDKVCTISEDEETQTYTIYDKNGKTILDDRYQFATVATDINGDDTPYLGIVKQNRYGMLDDKGEFVIEPKYENIKIVNNLAIVENNDTYGVIDLTSKRTLPAVYQDINADQSGMMIAQTRYDTLLDEQGKVVVRYPLIASLDKGVFMFCQTDKTSLSLCGTMDKTGKIIVPPQYRTVASMNERWYESNNVPDLLIVQDMDYKWALFELSTGKKLTPFKYDNILLSEQKEGLRVMVDEKYGFIDHTGKETIKPIYDYADEFDAGLTKVQLGDDWFYINKQGQKVGE